MAASKQLQIRAALAALLVASLVDVQVYENREFSLAQGVTSQVHVNLESSEPIGDLVHTDHPRSWRTVFQFVMLARKDGTTEASDVADDLWVQVYQIVMADRTLNDLAWEMLPGEATVDVEEADTSVCRLTWMLTVHHNTINNTLTT